MRGIRTRIIIGLISLTIPVFPVCPVHSFLVHEPVPKQVVGSVVVVVVVVVVRIRATYCEYYVIYGRWDGV